MKITINCKSRDKKIVEDIYDILMKYHPYGGFSIKEEQTEITK